MNFMIDYEYILKRIGLNLRGERSKLGWSQEKFAEYADVHPNYIGKIERGEQNLTVKKIVSLANTLQVPIEEILNFSKKIR